LVFTFFVLPDRRRVELAMLWLALQARRRATAAAHRLHACALGHAHARLARRGTTVPEEGDPIRGVRGKMRLLSDFNLTFR